MKLLTLFVPLLALFSCNFIHDHDAEKQGDNGDSGTHPIIGTWYFEVTGESGSEISEGFSLRKDVEYENFTMEYNLTFNDPDVFIVRSFYTKINSLTGAALDSLLKSDGAEPTKPDTGTWSISNDTLSYSYIEDEVYKDPYWINGDTLFIDMDGELLKHFRKD